MPTTNINPDTYIAYGDTDDWQVTGAGGDPVVAVSDNSNGTYVNNYAGAYSEPFNQFRVGLSDLIDENGDPVAADAVIEKVEACVYILEPEYPLDGYVIEPALGIVNAPAVTIGPGVVPVNPYGGIQKFDMTALITTGRTWTVADVNSLQFYVRMDCPNPSQHQPIAKMWVEVTWLNANYVPPSYEEGRQTAARMMRFFRRLVRPTRIELPPWALDADVLDDVLISKYVEGYGDARDNRGWFMLQEIVSNPQTLKVEAIGVTMHDYAMMLWDTMKSPLAGAIFTRGVARLSSGGRRVFTRDSVAYVRNAPSPLKFVYAQKNVERISDVGTLLERGSDGNFILDSSFRESPTLWTLSGPTLPVIYDLEALKLFEDNYHFIQFAGDGNGATDIQALSNYTNMTPVAGDNAMISIWHMDRTGHGMKFFVQRQSDGFYLTNIMTWQAGKAWISISPSASMTEYERFDYFFIPTTSNIRIGIGLQNGGTNGQVNAVGHVQVGRGNDTVGYNYGSPIVTRAAVVTRAPDHLYWENFTAARVWPPSGAATFIWWPIGSFPPAGKPTLLHVYHDATNYDWVHYDVAAGEIVWQRRWNVGPSGFQHARVPFVPGGQPVRIAMRWTTTEAELDMGELTTWLSVDGVSAYAEDFADASPGQTATSTVHMGHKWDGAAASEWATGYFSDFEVTDEMLTPEEANGRP